VTQTTSLNAGIDTGIPDDRLKTMAEFRKITVEVSENLLENALASTGEGITQTVRRGLELVAAGRAYEELRRLRGKVRLGIELEALREDR
jgi:hypothetical protein